MASSRCVVVALLFFLAEPSGADTVIPPLPGAFGPPLPLHVDPDGDYAAYCDSPDSILNFASYPDCYIDHRFDGFHVAVHRPAVRERLAADIGVMLDVVRAQITMIRLRVPVAAVATLRDTPIILTDVHELCAAGGLGCYLPDDDLVLLYTSPDDSGQTFASIFPAWPAFLFHELAHAYQNKVLGWSNRCVNLIYDLAIARGDYESVAYNHPGLDPVHHNGPGLSRAYALTNEHEFFAVFSEIYFTGSAWEPYNRAILLETDHTLAGDIRNLWERPDSCQHFSQ